MYETTASTCAQHSAGVAGFSNHPQTGDNLPVPFHELHPLARVRALRAMADGSGADRHAFDVLTALALRMDEHGRAMVGQVRIAREARCCERTARARLQWLERAGLLSRRRAGPRGLTSYQLACPTAAVLDAPTADRHGAVEPPVTARNRPPGPGVQTGTLAPPRPVRPARWGAVEGSDRRKYSTGTRAQTGTPGRTPPPRRVPVPCAALVARQTGTPDPRGALALLRSWRAAHQPSLPGIPVEAPIRPASASAGGDLEEPSGRLDGALPDAPGAPSSRACAEAAQPRSP